MANILLICSTNYKAYFEELFEEVPLVVHGWDTANQWNIKNIIESCNWKNLDTFVITPDICMILKHQTTFSASCCKESCPNKILVQCINIEFEKAIQNFLSDFNSFQKEVLENTNHKNCQVLLFPLVPTRTIFQDNIDEIHEKCHEQSPLPIILNKQAPTEEEYKSLSNILMKFDQFIVEKVDPAYRYMFEIYAQLKVMPLEFVTKIKLAGSYIFEMKSEFDQMRYWSFLAESYLSKVSHPIIKKMDENVTCKRVVVVCDKDHIPFLKSKHSVFHETSRITFLDFNPSVKQTANIDEIIFGVDNISDSALWLLFVDTKLLVKDSEAFSGCVEQECEAPIHTLPLPNYKQLEQKISSQMEIAFKLMHNIQQFCGGYAIVLPYMSSYLVQSDHTSEEHKQLHSACSGRSMERILYGDSDLLKKCFNFLRHSWQEHIRHSCSPKVAELLKQIFVIDLPINLVECVHSQTILTWILKTLDIFKFLFTNKPLAEMTGEVTALLRNDEKFTNLTVEQKSCFEKQYNELCQSVTRDYDTYVCEPLFSADYDAQLRNFMDTRQKMPIEGLKKHWKTHWAQYLKNKRSKVLQAIRDDTLKKVMAYNGANESLKTIVPETTVFSPVRNHLLSILENYHMFVTMLACMKEANKYLGVLEKIRCLGVHSYEGLKCINSFRRPLRLYLYSPNAGPFDCKKLSEVINKMCLIGDVFKKFDESLMQGIASATAHRDDVFLGQMIKENIKVTLQGDIERTVLSIRGLQYFNSLGSYDDIADVHGPKKSRNM